MKRKLAVASAALFAASVFAAPVSAQAPAPGNVDPSSQRSGAEESGTGQTIQPNQPTPPAGTTGSGSGMRMAPSERRDPGINANTNPASKESGAEESGEPAPKRR